MDRRMRFVRVALATAGLGFVGATSGCRHTRPEIPPERPYLAPGTAPSAAQGGAPNIEFSSQPAIMGGALGGAAASMTPAVPSNVGQYGQAPRARNEPSSMPGADRGVSPASTFPGFPSSEQPRGVMGEAGAPPSPL